MATVIPVAALSVDTGKSIPLQDSTPKVLFDRCGHSFEIYRED
jgi:hypothetical protein